MPEGPKGAPRLTNIGPLSRSTEDEIRSHWDKCPTEGKRGRICEQIKLTSIAILEGQGVFAECDTIVDINGGDCKNVAVSVAKKVDGVRVISIADDDHVWIEYEGLHYDAEVPTGVSDPFELPFFKRIKPIELLPTAKQAAKAKGTEPPETVDDMIKDITDEVLD